MAVFRILEAKVRRGAVDAAPNCSSAGPQAGR